MKSRILKVLTWAAILLGGLVTVLLVANAIFVWRSGRALENRLEALRAEGQPLSLAELAPEPVPVEDDAAVYIRRARADIQAVRKEVRVVEKEGQWPNDPTDAEELKAVAEAIAAYPKIMPLLERAAQCSNMGGGDFGTTTQGMFESEGMEEIMFDREVARYLRDRSFVLTAQGQRDEALETVLIGLRLSRLRDRPRPMSGTLVEYACRGIAIGSANRTLRSGPVAEGLRDDLAAELARHDLKRPFRQGIQGECAYSLTAMREMDLGRWWIGRGYWNNTKIYLLDVINGRLAQAREPYSQFAQAAPLSAARPSSPWLSLIDMADKATVAYVAACVRTEAMMRCLGVVNEIARREQRGEEVQSLDDLDIAAERKIDPFTGKALILKREADGWLVYSVGENFQDDGGAVDRDGKHLDDGLGPVEPLPALAGGVE